CRGHTVHQKILPNGCLSSWVLRHCFHLAGSWTVIPLSSTVKLSALPWCVRRRNASGFRSSRIASSRHRRWTFNV
ncbi:hypothetical protein BDZ89DRAFT_1160565, partial [Hymenopellis radicata]